MPISPTSRRIILTASALVLLIGSLLLSVIPILLERWINQYDLQRAFHEATGGTISTGTIHLRIFPAPHLIVPAGKMDLPDVISGRWQEIRIHPRFRSILSGRIRIREFRIIGPDATAAKSLVSGSEGPSDLAVGPLTPDHLRTVLLGAIGKMGAGLNWISRHAPEASVRVRDGRLHLVGEPGTRLFSLHAIDARLNLPPDALQIELDCKSGLFKALRVAGTVDARTLEGQLTLWFKNLDSKRLADLAGGDRFLDRVEGLLSGHVTLNLAGLSKIESHLSFRLPELTLQRLATPLTVRNIFIDSTVLIDENTIRFDLDRVYAAQPLLNLTGHLQAGGPGTGLQVHLVGSGINIAEARRVTLTLAGDSETTVNIFDVLRDGNVPWISWQTEGPDIAALGVFGNMKLTGEVEAGQLFIPGAELQLTEVNGVADISDEILRGESLSARHETTTGREGKLWIDFGSDDMPLFLEIETHLKDVGILPPRLVEWVDNAPFQEELQRLSRVRGEARGMMILDSRKGQGLEVTADVTQCRLEARYDRIPWEVRIEKGQVQYTGDRIAVDQMDGRIGATRFSGLKARVDFSGEPLLHLDSARLAVDLNAVLPWLASMEALETTARQYKVAGDTAHIARLSLHGPFFTPARWAYRLQGRIDRFALEAANLPDALNFSDFVFATDDNTLKVESTGLSTLDMDVTGKGHTVFRNGQLQSFDIGFNGRLGARMDKWINDLFEENEDFFLMRTPLDVSAATLNWRVGNPYMLTADFKTSGGVRVSLANEWQPDVMHRERVHVVDAESQATISIQQQSGQVAFSFEGALTSKTLDRLLLNNPFPSGRLKGDFQVAVDPAQPARSTAEGNLTAANIFLPLEMAHRVHISQLHLAADNNLVQIAPSAFLIDDSWHTLEGQIKLAAERFHINLQHEGAFFELPADEASPPQEDHRPLERWLNMPVDGEIRSRLSVLKWGEHRWVPMQTKTVLRPGQWKIQFEEAGLCGIQTTGTVVLDSETAAIDLQHTARKASLNSTLSCLLAKPDLIDGRFNLDGRLSGEAPLDQLGQSLDGHFKFKAKDGRIHRFDLLGRILAAINLTELVRGKKSDLMGEGLAYREIEIEAQLEESKLTFDRALIDGASAEIAAKGSLDLNADKIDLIVLVAPLKTVDALVKFTPIVNTWLEGTLVSIPVRVSGDLQDPSITPMSPTAVGSSLLNLLKNTVQLPIKLVAPLFEDDKEDENETAP